MKKPKDVNEIIEQYLKKNGYNGLCEIDVGCACELSDLFPCNEDFQSCVPGYKIPDPTGEADFLITKRKPRKK